MCEFRSISDWEGGESTPEKMLCDNKILDLLRFWHLLHRKFSPSRSPAPASPKTSSTRPGNSEYRSSASQPDRSASRAASSSRRRGPLPSAQTVLRRHRHARARFAPRSSPRFARRAPASPIAGALALARTVALASGIALRAPAVGSARRSARPSRHASLRHASHECRGTPGGV